MVCRLAEARSMTDDVAARVAELSTNYEIVWAEPQLERPGTLMLWHSSPLSAARVTPPPAIGLSLSLLASYT